MSFMTGDFRCLSLGRFWILTPGFSVFIPWKKYFETYLWISGLVPWQLFLKAYWGFSDSSLTTYIFTKVRG